MVRNYIYLDILDDQDPLVIRVVLSAEPLVRGEGLFARRQDVHVTVSHPGHLQVCRYQ